MKHPDKKNVIAIFGTQGSGRAEILEYLKKIIGDAESIHFGDHLRKTIPVEEMERLIQGDGNIPIHESIQHFNNVMSKVKTEFVILISFGQNRAELRHLLNEHHVKVVLILDQVLGEQIERLRDYRKVKVSKGIHLHPDSEDDFVIKAMEKNKRFKQELSTLEEILRVAKIPTFTISGLLEEMKPQILRKVVHIITRNMN